MSELEYMTLKWGGKWGRLYKSTRRQIKQDCINELVEIFGRDEILRYPAGRLRIENPDGRSEFLGETNDKVAKKYKHLVRMETYRQYHDYYDDWPGHDRLSDCVDQKQKPQDL